MKDAKGHGSEKRGGARYEVQVQPYSLAANKVGQHIGEPTVISKHNSLDAAGRVLGSMIRGKRQGEAQGIAGQGNGYKIGAVYKTTGAFIPRNQARTDIENAKPFSNISGGQVVASNAHAASTLASGSKSDRVPIHEAMKAQQDKLDSIRDESLRRAAIVPSIHVGMRSTNPKGY